MTRKYKLKLKYCIDESGSLMAVNVSAESDITLVRLGGEMGFPRGFMVLVDRDKNRIIGSGTFYPKFSNDSRNPNTTALTGDSTTKISFFVKYSGSLGITTLFIHPKTKQPAYTVSSKNATSTTVYQTEDGIVPFSYTRDGQKLIAPYMTPAVMQKLLDLGITSIGTENFSTENACHGYGYKKSGFIVISMSKNDETGKPVFLPPAKLQEVCDLVGLPTDAPIQLSNTTSIKGFLRQIDKYRNVLSLPLLTRICDSLEINWNGADIHRQLIDTDIIEGFVVRRYNEEEAELPSIKYKCWPYQMVTQVVRPICLDGLAPRVFIHCFRNKSINSILDSDGELPHSYKRRVEEEMLKWCPFPDSPVGEKVRNLCRWLPYYAAQQSLIGDRSGLLHGCHEESDTPAYWVTIAKIAQDKLCEVLSAVDWDLEKIDQLPLELPEKPKPRSFADTLW
eukprot:TRINITY_DN2132_c1_g6_i1.p1 TRINITY_DN2132_c1_g6~~TRINITY_DN2132_c1_g6_i1.p1  ORF type:complete len:517 (+),score=78.60 TRINITY_DN2132_c1_g6_i1:202-1551(+)